MQRILIFTIGIIALLPFGLYAQQSSQPLTNQDVVNMVKAGLTPDVVVAKIKSSRCDFDTSPSVLEDLKKADMPDAVILAMIEAPVIRAPFIQCTQGGVDALKSPDGGAQTAHLECGEKITIVSVGPPGWYLIRTRDGKEGYVSHYFIGNIPAAPSANRTTPPTAASSASPTLPPNVLRAVAWRGVPWATTSYYQQPGSSFTSCTGQGQWLGNIYQSNLSCAGSYTPAQSIPMSWQHYTIYNLVETSDSYVVLSCTRNVAWSKCSYFVPGSVLSFQNKKGQVYVTGQRAGKSKEESVKYEIVATQPK